MEEGELEPETELDAAPEVAPESEDHRSPVPLETDEKEVKNECQLNDTDTAVVERKPSSEEKPIEDIGAEVKDAEKEADMVPDVRDDPTKNTIVTDAEVDAVGDVDNQNDECLKANTECKEEKERGPDMEKPVVNEEEHKQDKGVDAEASAGFDKPELNGEVPMETKFQKK